MHFADSAVTETIAPATTLSNLITLLKIAAATMVGRWSGPGRISGATNAAHHPVGVLSLLDTARAIMLAKISLVAHKDFERAQENL